MQQLPFNGKKTKPTKLRKDYWQPMAVVCFRRGWDRGIIGLSVFQKLREFHRLHELSWGDELLRCTKQERGHRINDQRANAIADMAAVLSGRGLGNLIAEANAAPPKPWHASKPEYVAKRKSKRLYRATIFWADRNDRKYAREWTGNVSHERIKVILGANYWHDPQPDRGELVVVRPKAEMEVEAEAEPEAEAAQGMGENVVGGERPEETEQAIEEGDTNAPETAETTRTNEVQVDNVGPVEPSTEPEVASVPADEDPELDLWSPEEGVSDAVDQAYARKEADDAKKVAGELPAPAPAVGDGGKAGETKDGEVNEGEVKDKKDTQPDNIQPNDPPPASEIKTADQAETVQPETCASDPPKTDEQAAQTLPVPHPRQNHFRQNRNPFRQRW